MPRLQRAISEYCLTNVLRYAIARYYEKTAVRNEINAALIATGQRNLQVPSQNLNVFKSAFVSKALTAQMLRQLSDPVAIGTRMLPRWCKVLSQFRGWDSLGRDELVLDRHGGLASIAIWELVVRERLCKSECSTQNTSQVLGSASDYLFPLHTKKILHASAHLGLGRALHHVQHRLVNGRFGINNAAHNNQAQQILQNTGIGSSRRWFSVSWVASDNLFVRGWSR